MPEASGDPHERLPGRAAGPAGSAVGACSGDVDGASGSRDLLALGRRAGLDAVGIAAATPFESTRRDLETRAAAGLAAGMQFTYRNPRRSTDPSRILPGAASLVVGARCLRPPRPRVRPTSRSGGSPATPGRTTTPSCATPSAPLPTGSAGTGHRAVVVADDNALVDREAASTVPDSVVRQEREPAAPRGGQLVRARHRRHRCLARVHRADPTDDGCGSCRRCLDGCPTGAIVAPGVVDARRCLALARAGRPGSFPAEHREALGDRIYGCDDCQEVCPPNRSAWARRAASCDGPRTGPPPPTVEAWVPRARPARGLRRRAARPARAGGTCHGANPRVTCAATPSSRWATAARRATRGCVGCSSASGRRRTSPPRARRLGARPASVSPTSPAPTAAAP
ncbi:MAG: 4Fe-4S double cluster binding domain-containing protein [Acidimicrobiia bacterium]|nr:4Fe-4S double cluster binding domain-containing protein [Acidimicrobiia bacterium]